MAEEIKRVKLEDIALDDQLQMRTSSDPDVLDDYSKMTDKLPPVKIILDTEGKLWLTDGWMRFGAHRKAGKKDILARIRPGTFEDAFIEAIQANNEHGVRRTPADKRRAVERLLDHPKYGTYTDNAIADLAIVSHPFVANVRKQHKPKGKANASSTRTGKDGKQYKVGGKVLCDRCQRIGKAGKDCLACAELNAGRRAAKKAEREKSMASGKAKFDFPKFHTQFGPIAQAPEALVKAHPEEKGCQEYKDAVAFLNRFIKIWNKWQAKILKKKG